MNTMNMPGFTAEISLFKHRTAYRMTGMAINRNDSCVAVIPQLSCWRECYGISSSNHELVQCYRVCTRLREIFHF